MRAKVKVNLVWQRRMTNDGENDDSGSNEEHEEAYLRSPKRQSTK